MLVLIMQTSGLEKWWVAEHNPHIIRSLLEFHILERRAEGGCKRRPTLS